MQILPLLPTTWMFMSCLLVAPAFGEVPGSIPGAPPAYNAPGPSQGPPYELPVYPAPGYTYYEPYEGLPSYSPCAWAARKTASMSAAPLRPTRCAKVQEKCTTAADCCDGNNQCINGFCTVHIG